VFRVRRWRHRHPPGRERVSPPSLPLRTVLETFASHGSSKSLTARILSPVQPERCAVSTTGHRGQFIQVLDASSLTKKDGLETPLFRKGRRCKDLRTQSPCPALALHDIVLHGDLSRQRQRLVRRLLRPNRMTSQTRARIVPLISRTACPRRSDQFPQSCPRSPCPKSRGRSCDTFRL
jgi:hypothetical protein